MSAVSGQKLNRNNEEIVKLMEQLRKQRLEMSFLIERQQAEKKKLQNEVEKLTFKLTLLCKSLTQRLQARSDYDKTIQDVEKHYKDLVDSSDKLLGNLKQETMQLEEIMDKKIGTPYEGDFQDESVITDSVDENTLDEVFFEEIVKEQSKEDATTSSESENSIYDRSPPSRDQHVRNMDDVSSESSSSTVSGMDLTVLKHSSEHQEAEIRSVESGIVQSEDVTQDSSKTEKGPWHIHQKLKTEYEKIKKNPDDNVSMFGEAYSKQHGDSTSVYSNKSGVSGNPTNRRQITERRPSVAAKALREYANKKPSEPPAH